MKKNNWWNRIFHKAELRINQKNADLQKYLYENEPKVQAQLRECTTLTELVEFHKKIWKDGYRNRNIGPDPYGMFQTENIENMTPKEVYLGGIWGLGTKNIPFWEERKNDKYGSNGYGLDPEKSLYGMIVDQYKFHLESNLVAISNKAFDAIYEYKAAGYIC